jgi:cytoskeletal protein CcmA (bactofilin family)
MEESMFNKKSNDASEVKESNSEPTIEVSTQETQEKPPRQEFSARSVSYVGPGLHLEGKVEVDEGLVVEGEVEGTITSTDNNLTVGKKGRICGELVGSVIEVRGTVEGEIYARDLVRLYSSAVIDGTIYCKKLVMDEGAVFNGSVDMNWDGEVAEDVPTENVDSEEKVLKVAG